MTRRSTAVGLFLTTWGLLLLEVFATRVLAIAVGAFAVYYTIAVAMLGLGAASTIVAVVRAPGPEEPARVRLWLVGSNIAAAVGVAAFFLAASLYRAHTNTTIEALPPMDTWQFMSLQRNADIVGALVVGSVLAIAYFFYGFSLAVIFRGAPSSEMSRLYAIDLVGAFVGSVAAILALEWGGYSLPLVIAVLFPAIAAIAYAIDNGAKTVRTTIAIAAVLAMVLAIPAVRAALEPQPSVSQLGHTMWRFRGYEAELLDYRWSSHGRTSAVKLTHPGGDVRHVMSYDQGIGQARLWKPDMEIPFEPAKLGLPNEAVKEITNVVSLPRLVFAVQKDPKRFLVLGAGAGADMMVIDKLAGGKADVHGVELVGDTVEWARDNFGLDKFYDRPNIHMMAAEAREFLARDQHKYDGIIMPSLQASPGYFMGTSSYGFAFSATREGLSSVVDHLQPTGVFTFVLYNKIQMGLALSEILRGRSYDPAKSVVLLGDDLPAKWWVIRDDMIMMVKPSGFTQEDITALQPVAATYGLNVLYHPFMQPLPDHPHVHAVTRADAAATLEPLANAQGSTIMPVTDDRPFPEDPMVASSYFESRFWAGPDEGTMTKDVERVWVTRRLHVMLLLGFTLVSILLIIGPLWIARRMRKTPALPVPHRANHLTFFGLLGFAFMMIEMAYILKLRILIGHPGHTIAIVLASVILFTGVGSALSNHTFKTGLMTFRRAALASAILGVTALLAFDLIVPHTIGFSKAAKYAIAFIIPILPAIAMGHMFPQGLESLSSERTRTLIPLALAMNALTGTFVAGVATIMSQALGTRALAIIGAIGYLIVAVMPHAPREQAPKTDSTT